MSQRNRKHWLLAYDIRDPRRLQRIHAYMSRHGWPLQYSVFGLEMSELQLRDLLDDLCQLMDTTQDDIRVYHLPPRCKVWTLGRVPFAEGIEMNASVLLKFLARQPSAKGHFQKAPKPSANGGYHSSFSSKQPNHCPRTQGD